MGSSIKLEPAFLAQNKAALSAAGYVKHVKIKGRPRKGRKSTVVVVDKKVKVRMLENLILQV